jgi:hypothetical protein
MCRTQTDTKPIVGQHFLVLKVSQSEITLFWCIFIVILICPQKKFPISTLHNQWTIHCLCPNWTPSRPMGSSVESVASKTFKHKCMPIFNDQNKTQINSSNVLECYLFKRFSRFQLSSPSLIGPILSS